MADIQEVIVVSGIHTNIIDPVDGKSKNYKEVTTWWDGTPMNNSKVDGAWFRRKGTTYLRQVIDKEGELFLEKDTVSQLRALSPLEILFLRGGVYKGVKLNGQEEKGDISEPIEYYLSSTTESDDGINVFEVGGIKLEHDFDTVPINFRPLILTVNTGTSTTYTIQTKGNYLYKYDVESNGVSYKKNRESLTLTFPTAGIYDIAIKGIFPAIHQNGEQAKLIDVKQWGDVQFKTMSYSFSGCTNITQFSATDTPNLGLCTSLERTFYNASNFNSNINNWDVGFITNFFQTFRGCTSYDSPLDKWDVSSGITFHGMFHGASVFNQNINSWNVRKAQTFHGMFRDAVLYNQPMGNWEPVNVSNFGSMFSGCTNFNQNLGAWYVKQAVDMHAMFYNCTNFNGTVNSTGDRWQTPNLKTTTSMFYGCTNFNQPMDNWKTESVTNMLNMFFGAKSFNQDISSWNVSNVSVFTGMFNGASSFNQDLTGWNTKSATHMNLMFSNATSFNGDVSTFDTSNVVSLNNMFVNAVNFNGYINDWNISKVTGLYRTFDGASSFNQPLDKWDVSNITTRDGFGQTFKNATSFNQDLRNWNVHTFNASNPPFEFSLNSGLSDEYLPIWGRGGLDDYDQKIVTKQYTFYGELEQKIYHIDYDEDVFILGATLTLLNNTHTTIEGGITLSGVTRGTFVASPSNIVNNIPIYWGISTAGYIRLNITNLGEGTCEGFILTLNMRQKKKSLND